MKYQTLNYREIPVNDICHRGSLVANETDYFLEREEIYVQSPEDYLLAKEDAELAGEEFEGSPYGTNILRYKTPHTGKEVVKDKARNEVKADENKLFNMIGLDDDIKKAERLYKNKVKKRIQNIEELFPRLLFMYKIHEKQDRLKKERSEHRRQSRNNSKNREHQPTL